MMYEQVDHQAEEIIAILKKHFDSRMCQVEILLPMITDLLEQAAPTDPACPASRPWEWMNKVMVAADLMISALHNTWPDTTTATKDNVLKLATKLVFEHLLCAEALHYFPQAEYAMAKANAVLRAKSEVVCNLFGSGGDEYVKSLRQLVECEHLTASWSKRQRKQDEEHLARLEGERRRALWASELTDRSC
jgi:hypothetical protein